VNLLKYVPLSAKARVENPTAIFTVRIGQSQHHLGALFAPGVKQLRVPNVREADLLAARQGWIRLSELSASERRDWKRLYEEHRKGQKNEATV
jgi:hypothetical protein